MPRDTKIDTLKFLLIFLVVLGHLSYHDYGLGINKLIYSFHMPLFVFLSGYFTKSEQENGVEDHRKKHAKWAVRILLIYLCAQAGHALLTLLLGGSLSWKMLIYPQLALWYLLCLVYWRVAVWTLFRNTDDRVLFVLSVFLSILSGIVPLNEELSFQRAFAFFPFFIAGFLFRKLGLMRWLDSVPVWKAIALSAFCLVAARLIPRYYMPKFQYDTFLDFTIRCVQTAVGFVLCLALFRLSRLINLTRLAQWGAYTLWIYIGHTYLIRLNIPKLLEGRFHITFNLFEALVLSTVYCGIFILMAKLYQKLKYKPTRRITH